MRIRYTTTEKCCPICHAVLETDNSEFLALIFMPFILLFLLFGIPYFIAHWILYEGILCVYIPKICKTPIIECPNCGAKVRISKNPTYDELNQEDKFLYDNRNMFRAACFFGGTLIYGVLFSFFLAFNDELGKIFGWIGFSLAFLCLFIVIAIVYYWKTNKVNCHNRNDNQSKELLTEIQNSDKTKVSDGNNEKALSQNIDTSQNDFKLICRKPKKTEDCQEKSLKEKLNLILDYKYFIELESYMQLGEFDLVENLIKLPCDALDYAVDKCNTPEEIFKTKFDFFIYLVNLDSKIKNNIVTSNGFSYFLDFSCDMITALFSDIIAYISDDLTLKWHANEEGDDGELIASGSTSEWFYKLGDVLDEKGAFFNNSFKANLITDIWYEFLNNSIS